MPPAVVGGIGNPQRAAAAGQPAAAVGLYVAVALAVGGTVTSQGSAWPDATNTGVPQGTTLTPSGSVATSAPGQVISSLAIAGTITVNHPGVTIQNCTIESSGTGAFGVAIRHVNDATIRNCAISGTRPSGGTDPDGGGRLQFAVKDVYGDTTGTAVLACNIWDTANSIGLLNGLIQDNYVHDMGYIAADHVDCIIAEASSGLTIRHNTLLNAVNQTSCIALYSQTANSDHVTVDNNLMAGGGYCVYGGNDPFQGTFMVFTNNQFSTRYYSGGGSFGVLAHYASGNTGNQWTGNMWADGPNVGQPAG